MFEFETKIEELLESKLKKNYGMSLKQFRELDVNTQESFIQSMYRLHYKIINKDEEKTKVKKYRRNLCIIMDMDLIQHIF